jgi:peptidoglycan/xylan/chitin deacetylase (PgdA/CDA1 family)
MLLLQQKQRIIVYNIHLVHKEACSQMLFLMLFAIVYWGLPFLLTRLLDLGVLKHNISPKIAFTFDDGPNPAYTPELLDLLKKNDIKATFFVVGSKAEQYPDLIKRMHSEGHLIGIHNYVHKSNWIMAPWTIRRHLDISAAIIENITGESPVYYRPPWGLINIFDFFLLKKYRIVLWSVMAEDWKVRGGSEKIKDKLKDIEEGDIVLLHDCGKTFGADEEAPRNTIDALKDVFSEWTNQNRVCVRIDEWERGC